MWEIKWICCSVCGNKTRLMSKAGKAKAHCGNVHNRLWNHG